MSAAAVTTLVATGLAVLVLAAAFIALAVVLLHVNRRLDTISSNLESVVGKTAPVTEVVEELNRELAEVDGALRAVVDKPRAPWVVTMAPRTSLPPKPVPASSTPAAPSRPAPVENPGTAMVLRERIGRVRGATSIEQKFSLLASVIYLGIGVIGFFLTGFAGFASNSDVALFGIFGINPFHNVVHLGIGALWLFAALVLTPPATEGVNLAIAGVYILVAALGYLGYLQDLLSVDGPFAPDNFLHLVTGLIVLPFAGFLNAFRGTDTGRRAGA